MLWNLQNILTFFPLFHPSVLSHRCHCPPGFASGRCHLLSSQACFLTRNLEKSESCAWPTKPCLPWFYAHIQKILYKDSSGETILRGSMNKIIIPYRVFPQRLSWPFSNSVRCNIWFQGELGISVLPKVHKKLHLPLVATADFVTHIEHIHIKEFFHFHAKCYPGLSVCHTAARWDKADLFVPSCFMGSCQIFWTLLEVKPTLSSRVSQFNISVHLKTICPGIKPNIYFSDCHPFHHSAFPVLQNPALWKLALWHRKQQQHSWRSKAFPLQATAVGRDGRQCLNLGRRDCESNSIEIETLILFSEFIL